VTAVVGGRVVGEADWGILATDVERIPVHFYEDLVGHLTVARREPNTAPNRADDRVLSLLLPHVATAMHLVRLTADLNAARGQAVRAREEERRRIRRDLHDGLGPVLAGLGLSLEGVADLVGADPERARVLLVELGESVHATIADVRRLVYELRPPALDDLGLLGALRAHVNSMARHPGTVVVTVDAPTELPELPAAVEVAIFRIAMEALTNVERHAHAYHCTVRLRLDDEIELTVEDDGVGINGHSLGVGVPSMRERVRELNGIWSLEARQPTGTRLRARLPVGAS
jgi:signal transduction histidine kinase